MVALRMYNAMHMSKPAKSAYCKAMDLLRMDRNKRKAEDPGHTDIRVEVYKQFVA